jgi:hypothetical protein
VVSLRLPLDYQAVSFRPKDHALVGHHWDRIKALHEMRSSPSPDPCTILSISRTALTITSAAAGRLGAGG